MASGRCAGCGKSGTVKAVQSHIMSCAAFAALYKADKTRALSPAEEYVRWQAEGKRAASMEMRGASKGRNEARRQQQAGRFARLPDILEDE